MIRDPSDGTVREKPMPGSEPGITGQKPAIDSGTSGLATGRLKESELARLERAREWVKNWHHRKIVSPEQGVSALQPTPQFPQQEAGAPARHEEYSEPRSGHDHD